MKFDPKGQSAVDLHRRSVVPQDSIDLFLGNYAVDEADRADPLRDPKDWKFLTVRRAPPPPMF